MSCQVDGSLLDESALQKFDNGRWVPLPESNGRARRVLSTSLKAGAKTAIRLRLAPAARLGGDVDRFEVVPAWAGVLAGTDERFYSNDAGDFQIR